MKLRDNFYFWASWFLLSAFLLIIYYLYQIEFSLENFLDIKTILLVLGTLGGAFLGAYFAGKYSTDQVTRQLKHQTSLIEKEKLEVSLKYTGIAIVYLNSVHTILNDTLSVMHLTDGSSEVKDEINFLLPQIRKCLEEIKILNLINVLRHEIYFPIHRCIYTTDHIIDVLLGVLRNKNQYIDTSLAVNQLCEAISTFEKSKTVISKEFEKDINSQKIINNILKEI